MFFDGWDSVARIVVLAALIYTILVAALRIIGEQALAKMSAYDLIVTVALGSFLAHLHRALPPGSHALAGEALTPGAAAHRAASAPGVPGGAVPP
jgi:hypothetical protein